MYSANVCEPWFSFIKNNKKQVEGRLCKGQWSEMKMSDILNIYCNGDCIVRKVIGIRYYKTFEEYLMNEALDVALPGVDKVNLTYTSLTF